MMTKKDECFITIKALNIGNFTDAERILPKECGVTVTTARVYYSEWRKMSGKARTRRTKEELNKQPTGGRQPNDSDSIKGETE